MAREDVEPVPVRYGGRIRSESALDDRIRSVESGEGGSCRKYCYTVHAAIIPNPAAERTNPNGGLVPTEMILTHADSIRL